MLAASLPHAKVSDEPAPAVAHLTDRGACALELRREGRRAEGRGDGEWSIERAGQKDADLAKRGGSADGEVLGVLK